ncbi:phosphoribosyltransferase [Antarcticibacterium flavum]|uniref:Phosphoribosyltransferase n=1 Tax=Antarcticibacterium flavum TaxID=2058175 RepID=A0A5B7X5I3_9FLAO|nr:MULTISPECIES: phosphoribosyltransferase family protein [Antarcticibacterium]MCM4159945.1 phosphoribosyltransferase [Antarcticibacterium sp. W02-3]QCY70460.1 phosphoribosyltransferase [Antarcticibacterium flavum]
MPANIILNNEQIQHKIRRIAYQIFESNVNEEHLIIAGISKSGFVFAQRLKVELEEISGIQVELCEVHVDKKNPHNEVKTSLPASAYTGKSIVLTDDVLNSGATLIYGVKHFLEVPLKQFKTAVLVDRSHKKYPVKADFKGISLSTSLNETVQVQFKKGRDKVELL